MRAWLLALIVAFAGCTEPPAEPEPVPMEQATLEGVVMTSAFNPLPGVLLVLDQTPPAGASVDATTLTATSDAEGRFSILAWPGPAQLTATLADHDTVTSLIDLPENGTVIVMDRIQDPARIEKHPFSGYFDCGADHVIFAGSCDDFAGAVVPVGGTLADEREFVFDVEDGWKTIVVDIAFDPLPPTLEALRLAAYSPDSEAAVLTYERYHAGSGAEPFTLRIEPGMDYGHDLPAPENATTIRLEVFPQGHGYYQVCDGDGTCFTGVGASARVDFDIVASVFYHEAAPDGWTLRD